MAPGQRAWFQLCRSEAQGNLRCRTFLAFGLVGGLVAAEAKLCTCRKTKTWLKQLATIVESLVPESCLCRPSQSLSFCFLLFFEDSTANGIFHPLGFRAHDINMLFGKSFGFSKKHDFSFVSISRGCFSSDRCRMQAHPRFTCVLLCLFFSFCLNTFLRARGLPLVEKDAVPAKCSLM